MRFRRSLGALVVLVSLFGLAIAEEETNDSKESADSPLTLVVQIRNRMYPTWKDSVRVQLDEAFFLGDTSYRAIIREFLPDFRIIDGKIGSITQTLSNPAGHVFVFNDSATVDSSWAFLNHPPHFSATSFFSFQLQDITGFEPQEDPTGEQ